MSYEPPVYPTSIPSQTGATPDLPDRLDDLDWLLAARYNELKKELCAVMTELGTQPKGSYADVKTRLAALAVNPMSAAGDMIIGGSDGVPTRLAAAAANLKLFMNAAGDAPEFANGFYIASMSRDLSSGSGTQSITGVPFKPSMAIILSLVGNTYRKSTGFDTGTAAYCLFANDAVTAGISDWDNVNSIYLKQDVSIFTSAKITSWNSGGLTVTFAATGSNVGTAILMFLLFR